MSAGMARHLTIAQSLGAAVYFCDSRSPWQRGSNENTNGLLRGYFRLVLGTAMSWSGQLPVACREDAGRADLEYFLPPHGWLALGVSPRLASVCGLTQQRRDAWSLGGAFSKSDCQSRLSYPPGRTEGPWPR